ncbi:MAG: hypothetical protein KF865_14845 [Bdellovibrionaceae bacterium]|nr:hypothetical protein [Pseudobdellovibrionaceae bacterium]
MPVVGKSFYAFCKKCDTDRYHTVLALPTDTSAKLQCEVCKAKSTWKKAAPRKATASGPRGAAAKAKANAAAARSAAHTAEFENLAKSLESTPEKAYSMKVAFEKDTKLKHPTFGLGYIRAVQPDKIEVVFQDEVRNLVHNRR